MTRNRNLSFGRLSTPSGIFRATVTKVNVDTISVRIPNLTGPNVYNDVPFYGDKPSVNDEIIVGFLNGNSATPVAMILTGEASTLTGGGSAGDIEGVTAGLGLSGGGTTGTVSLAFAPSELSSVTVATDDKVVIADTSDSDNPKHVTAQSIANLASASPGGSDHQVQFNDNSSFGGDANFTYDGSAVGLGATLTVGVNGTGHDVQFYGDSTDHWMKWDQSADELVLTLDSKLSFYDAAGGENIVAASDGHLEINAGTTLDLTAPTIDLNASTAVTVDGKIVFPATAPSDANINIEFAEGYKIYTDNTGAGSDNSRLWLDAPDNGEIVLGPRGGSDILDNMRLRSTTIAAEGNVNVTGNVGIGTTSPVGQLSVDSQNRQISIIDSGTVNYAEIRAHAVDSATSYANVNYNAYSHNFLIEGTSKIIIDNNGDIRPTTDSTSDLGTSSYYFELAYVDQYKGGNGSSSAPTYGFGSDANTGIYRKASDQLAIAAGGVEAYFATNGLHLASGDWFRTYGDSGIYFATHGGGWRMTGSTYIETYGSKSIDVKGNIKLNAMATFTGSGYATARRQDSTGILKEFTSSERWKTDLADIPLADAEKVLNCRPIYFRSKEEKEADPNSQVYAGISAESLQSAGYEWALKYDVDEDGNTTTIPRGIHYELLVTPLITIIKDLKARIEALES